MTGPGAKTTILGVDPGSHRTGWGLIAVQGAELEALAWGCLDLPKGALLAERLTVLHVGMTDLFEEHHPDEVAVEEVFVAHNAKSALILGHARGVILLACAQAGLTPFEYPANTVKQAVLGQAGQRATKERVAFMVRAILGMRETPEPADTSDALACAICHANKRDTPR